MFQLPFSKPSIVFEKRLTIVLLPLLIICIIIMKYFDAFLVNSVCKNGIVSFELAKELEISIAILDSWNGQSKIAASLSMGFDFLFLIVYSSFIALLIYKLNERLWNNKSFYAVGNLLIWAVFLAAFFDAIENLALIKLLLGDLQQHWSTIAFYFAVLKFAIIIICFIYILVNLGLFLFRRVTSE